MNDLLENKVSALMATQEENRKTILDLKKTIEEGAEERERMEMAKVKQVETIKGLET